jgi:uncharacterized membrane protein YqjE
MSELVTIYTVHQDNVAEIIRLLESRNLHPVVVDDVGKMGAYRSHQIRIAVPDTERDMAVGILAEAEEHNKTRLSGIVKVTNGIMLIIVALLILIIIVGFFDKQGKWSFVTWMLVITLASIALIRCAWNSKSRDQSKKSGL